MLAKWTSVIKTHEAKKLSLLSNFIPSTTTTTDDEHQPSTWIHANMNWAGTIKKLSHKLIAIASSLELFSAEE